MQELQTLQQPIVDETVAQAPAPEQTAKPKAKRGFALLDKDTLKSISKTGGKAAQASQRAHRFNSEEAARAGKLSGIARKNIARLKREQMEPQEAYKALA